MKYVYFGLLLFLLCAALLCGRYKRGLFRGLDRKEHPLKLFYPLSAKLTDLFRRFFSGNQNLKVRTMLKSLYVRENVEEENYLYSVKKGAVILAIFSAVMALGMIFCLTRDGAEYISRLERSDPGGLSQNYELQVDYEGKEELVEIPVEAEKYSREEILKLFDSSIETIEKSALGDNTDAENVNKPMKFPSQYGQIRIFWEIEDTDLLGYNGEIRAELEDGESLVINLFATLSLDKVSKTYSFPIVLTAPQLSERERLVSRILESVEENNNIYEKEVLLPDTLDGNSITFRKKKDDNEITILILGLLAVVVLAVFYDRGLEKKVKKRQEEMMIDFTEIVSKLTLLYEAGSSIRKAFEKIVADQEKKGETRFAYKEMKLALEKIRSGVREQEAYAQFGQRCGLHSYIKLGNILEQNLSKGTKGMKLLLKQETSDAFEARKRLARKKGEEAGTKMLVPMVLMMVVVVVIIAAPALMSIRL